MLIRFIAKNIFSFKDESEFNLFPNKTQRLPHHKITKNGINYLRLSAIYGANGSGKSNLIKSVLLLQTMIKEGKIINQVEDYKFKLCDENKNIPISFGIEFYCKSKIYYYSITFDEGKILNETLVESKKDIDIVVFERNNEYEKQEISFFEGYIKNNEKNKLFVEVLQEKLIEKNELLISFLNSKYKDEFKDVKNAFNWFDKTLIIIEPESKPSVIAHLLDKSQNLYEFVNKIIPNYNTGISRIDIKKEIFENFYNKDGKGLEKLQNTLKQSPKTITMIINNKTGEQASVVCEEDNVYVKRLVATHLNNKGAEVEFPMTMESDGTRRLIDYLPALENIINYECVYLIDEIERSIHPIIIKEIISKISLDTSIKGQLIFTTHESCLLDQDILRPDEIWFAQKDVDGSSKLYSLSEFNIHNTANIENGYLNGRYGGIPFLSNLHDLNWHNDEISTEK